MPHFAAHPEAWTPELREAAAWVQSEVGRLAEEKGLAVSSFSLEYGKRESGGVGGVPSLAQWGFHVTGQDREGGALPLHVFIGEDAALEDRGLAARILDLWTDRVETGGVP